MPMPTNFQIRIVVGTAIGPRGTIWRIWSQKNEVYAAHQANAHIDKLSFHSSGICRRAFTQSYGVPPSLNDRATLKWHRLPTPAAGAGKGALVLRVITPTAFLSSAVGPLSSKPVIWLPPRGNEATSFDVFFCREPRKVVINAFSKAPDSELVYYHVLPSGEGVGVSSAHGPWIAENFILPARTHDKKDMVIANVDPFATGRPFRVTFDNSPKDGDALICHDFGAFEAPRGDPLIQLISFAGTFSRGQVIANQDTIPKAWSLPKRPVG